MYVRFWTYCIWVEQNYREVKKMKAFLHSKRGTFKVLGVLMIIIVVFCSGFFFLNFVNSNVDFAKNIFDTQMSNLLLSSLTANTTHIVAFVKNTANKMIEFTLAYVNSMIATLEGGKASISPLTTGAATIVGTFIKGNTYTVELTNIFSISLSFAVTI